MLFRYISMIECARSTTLESQRNTTNHIPLQTTQPSALPPIPATSPQHLGPHNFQPLHPSSVHSPGIPTHPTSFDPQWNIWLTTTQYPGTMSPSHPQINTRLALAYLSTTSTDIETLWEVMTQSLKSQLHNKALLWQNQMLEDKIKESEGSI